MVVVRLGVGVRYRDLSPTFLNGVIGTKFKVVTGYPGNAEMLLAVERGEADGNAGTSWTTLVSIKADWSARQENHRAAADGEQEASRISSDVPLALRSVRKHEADRDGARPDLLPAGAWPIRSWRHPTLQPGA